MVGHGLFQPARILVYGLSALLALHPTPARAAGTTVEFDLISPVAGGRYRVTHEKGLPVVYMLQNVDEAAKNAWHFEWYIEYIDPPPPGPFPSEIFALGGVGVGEWSHAGYGEIIQGGDPLVGLAHPPDFPRPNTGFVKDMPPGLYRFRWAYSIEWNHDLNGLGICFDDATTASGYTLSLSYRIKHGNFTFTVDNDAPVVVQASLDPTLATVKPVETWYSPDYTITCAWARNVTEAANPCRATVNAAQAAKISSIMSWKSSSVTSSGSEPAITSSGASVTSFRAPYVVTSGALGSATTTGPSLSSTALSTMPASTSGPGGNSAAGLQPGVRGVVPAMITLLWAVSVSGFMI
ncbi:hypothetical protein B0H63DRAFT_491022 [Podospora didyma]|uniref:DUF7136 domain-containing protein n=1 Tax=Podospora didyma TaxID=330526 RepID=A0AAE0JWL4_9PEZI|nr:hypothetical protein B0H63DRAFT_491022 [Podospora didyma]